MQSLQVEEEEEEEGVEEGGGGDLFLTKEESTNLFDLQRRNEDLSCADQILVLGLGGLSETERRERIFPKIKGAVTAQEVPALEALTTPITRGGTPAPISFLRCGRIDTRKKIAAALKAAGIGTRVANGSTTERLNRYLIASAKDIGAALSIPESEQRRRVLIDFRGLEVKLDGVVVVKRSYNDNFVWLSHGPGEQVKRVKGRV